MYFTLGEVAALFVFGAVALYFLQALRVRELALQAAKRACTADDAQLLDETVSIGRLSISRDTAGRWRFWRQYRFEYSYDGEQRVTGTVIMLGHRVQAMVMAERPSTLH
jgi:hypothetical protein